MGSNKELSYLMGQKEKNQPYGQFQVKFFTFPTHTHAASNFPRNLQL